MRHCEPVRSLVPLHEGDVSEADRGSVPLYKGHSLREGAEIGRGISGIRFSIGDRYTSVRYWLAMTIVFSLKCVPYQVRVFFASSSHCFNTAIQS